MSHKEYTIKWYNKQIKSLRKKLEKLEIKKEKSLSQSEVSNIINEMSRIYYLINELSINAVRLEDYIARGF